MSYSLSLHLLDDLSRALLRAAALNGKTPEEWVATMLRQRLAPRDERLRRHFGAVNLGAPTGADNAEIDADLAQAYADCHAGP